MATLQGTDIESLNEDFINKRFLQSQEGTARSVVKKLPGVWLTLDRYAIVTAAKAASAKKGIKRQPAGAERGETMPKRGRGGSCSGSSRAEAQKRNPAQSRDNGEGTRKRSKPSGLERTSEGKRSSLWRDHRANRDVQVRPTRGGLREIRLHSERVMVEPQGVLPVRDGSYKSTHQPMHHSVR